MEYGRLYQSIAQHACKEVCWVATIFATDLGSKRIAQQRQTPVNCQNLCRVPLLYQSEAQTHTVRWRSFRVLWRDACSIFFLFSLVSWFPAQGLRFFFISAIGAKNRVHFGQAGRRADDHVCRELTGWKLKWRFLADRYLWLSKSDRSQVD
jgi:hypothetical protein